jgi:CRP-like cAMP-binding protein
VRAFLIEMGQRSQDGSSPVVVLPMSRYDIADYLAVSVETVSRALTALKRRGAIALPDKHRVMVIDPGALMEEQRRPAS